MGNIRRVAFEERRREMDAVAADIAMRHKRKISDQLLQGGWERAFNDFITDLCTFQVAYLKGPVLRRRRKISYQAGQDGKAQVMASEDIRPEFERVDPFNAYPEPGITNIEDGYFIERHRMNRAQVSELIGVPHYNEDALRAVLKQGPRNGASDQYFHYYEKLHLERKESVEWRMSSLFDAMEFWGCLLYTSPSPRDRQKSRMPSSA